MIKERAIKVMNFNVGELEINLPGKNVPGTFCFLWRAFGSGINWELIAAADPVAGIPANNFATYFTVSVTGAHTN